MRRPWDSYPISAVLEGIAAASSGALGFIAAIIAGLVIGFAAHGVTMADTRDGFFFLYLFMFFPLGLLQHLLNASGVFTALGIIVFTAIFFISERFKVETLLGLCLSIALYTFQAIGLTDQTKPHAWLRFAGIAFSIVAIFLGVRVLAVIGRNRETKRKANKASEAASEAAPGAVSSTHQG